MLEISRLQVLSLKPITLKIMSGECVVVRGASGSGKSMLLRSIADLEEGSGEVYLDGIERASMSGPAWRKRVRYVSAEAGWWRDTALEHFQDESYARGLAQRLDLDVGLLNRSISRLSTGERQRFAFARALEDNPKVLLLDEPTGALDGVATARVESLIQEARGAGGHIVLVTHDPEQGKRLADRSFIIQQGRLEEEA